MTTDLFCRQRGFSLVELMIAMVLGLIVIGGSLAVFASQRVTTRLSGEMADVQADGRVVLDAMARDARAAGDFGCWPVANPIDGRLNTMVFDVNKGGLFGFTATTLGAANTSTAPNGVVIVKAATPEGSIVALTGINGTLTNLAADMASEADTLQVKKPVEPFKSGDVAVITDCINWAKFQVTDVAAGSAAAIEKLAHTGGALTAHGGGNKDGNLGAVFRKDSTIGRLDSVWWFIGTVNSVKGLYRMSARDASPVLVSKRAIAMQLTYDLDTNADELIETTGKLANEIADKDWPLVRSMNIQLLLQSEKTSDAGGKASVTSFAGMTIPNDKRLYLPLQVNVALRNQ